MEVHNGLIFLLRMSLFLLDTLKRLRKSIMLLSALVTVIWWQHIQSFYILRCLCQLSLQTLWFSQQRFTSWCGNSLSGENQLCGWLSWLVESFLFCQHAGMSICRIFWMEYVGKKTAYIPWQIGYKYKTGDELYRCFPIQ